MQKKLIALAVAGMVAAPVAMAQSNVTVYGIADAFFGYHKQGDNKRTGIDSGGLAGSRIGFRGTEDLGNGLSAVFTLEYALAVDQNEGIGTGALRARQQFVGLQGGFGFVGLGRQYAPGFFVGKYDAAASVPFGPQALLAAGAGATIQPASPARWNNSINYKSPNFGGVTLNANYSLGEQRQDGNRRQGDQFGIGADYAAGPIGFGVIYHHGKDIVGARAQGTAGGPAFDLSDAEFDPVTGLLTGVRVTNPVLPPSAGETRKEWFVGGSYDFGMAKLLGSWQRVKVASDTNKVWQLGVQVPVTEVGRAYLAYGKLDHENSSADARATILGYNHSLSRRTTLYTAWTHMNNKSASSLDALGLPGPIRTAGKNANNFVLGVNHTF